jgi:hypothetical protein
MLLNLFYLISPIFIFVELYQIFNRDQIWGRLSPENLEKYNPKVLLLFYITKSLYITWIFSGLFLPMWFYSSILITLGFLKYPILLIGKNLLINIYDLINCFISSIILIIIFMKVISQLL